MNVSGTWQGEYTFGESEVVPHLAGETVRFTMQLKQGWLGVVNGTVQDDKREGFAEEGTIKGRVKGAKKGGGVLEFRKLMPVMRLIHERNRITIDQWAERYKFVLDADKPHMPILHVGDISDDGQTIEGDWRMPGDTILIPGSSLRLEIPSLRGTWKMSRTT